MNATKNPKSVEHVGVRVHVEVPTDIHARVRIQAIERGITLKAAVIEALDEWAAPARAKR
jgi:LDH2 family malate/lactate/ureidoglycolate dehydrogenase